MSSDTPRTLFARAVYHAAEKNSPSNVLKIMAPLILTIIKGQKEIIQKTQNDAQISPNMTPFQSVWETYEGNINHLSTTDQLVHLFYISEYFDDMATAYAQDSSIPQNTKSENLLGLASIIAQKTLHFEARQKYIDLLNIIPWQVNPLEDTASYFSPRESLEFMLAYHDFFKGHFASQFYSEDQKRSRAGVKSHFTAAVRNIENPAEAPPENIIQGFENIAHFYESKRGKVKPLIAKEDHWKQLDHTLKAIIQYCRSYVPEDNKNAISLSGATRPRADVIQLDGRRKTGPR